MYKSMGRNRMIKRMICGVLATVMLCTSVDVSVFAAENDRIKESSAAEGTEDILEGNQLSEVSSDIVNFDDSEEKRNAGEQDKEEGKDDKNDRDRNAVEQNSEEEDKEEQYEEIISNDGDGEANLFSGGTGTEDDPYLISSVEDMENIPQSTGSLAITSGTKTYYRLTKDLTLNNWTTRNMPLGCFDGGGHTIYDLKVVQGYLGGNTHGAALFCDIWSIKNLTVENAEVSTDNIPYYKNDYSPSVFAINVNDIENCCLKGEVLLKGSGNSGGFVSKAEKNIKNCENQAQIIVKQVDEEHLIRFGCFASTANGTVENLVNKEGTKIIAEGEVGGIARYAYSFSNCKNYADISIGDVIYKGQKSSPSAAGIVLHAGSIYANKPLTISNCKNYGNISSNGQAAGISIDISGGRKGNSIVVKNCSNEGNILSQYEYGECAGIAVEINSNVWLEGCSNYGIITGSKIAGVACEASCKGVKIESCYNKGELRICNNNSSSSIAGGIIGSINGGSYYDGDKNVKKAYVENCYNSGKVIKNDSDHVIVGGIIATLNMAGHEGDMPEGKYVIRNCYNNVSFTGFKDDEDHVAGIIGYYYYSRTDYENYGCEVETGSCYCLDRGYSYIPTYYDEHDKEYKQDNEYVSEAFSGFKQCTDAQMKKQETYEGFDFGSVWAMGEDDYPYPILIGSGGLHSGYEITLDPNGGTVSDTVLYTNKTGKLISLPRAKKDNHRFMGWYTESDGGEKVDATTIFTEDKTIYAHWKAYDPDKKVQIEILSPKNGAHGVPYLNSSMSYTELSLSFTTSSRVAGLNDNGGKIRVYQYDDTSRKIICEASAKYIEFEDYETGSLIKVNLTNHTVVHPFRGNRKYYVEIEEDVFQFEDSDCYTFIDDKDIWSFTTGSVVTYRDEQGIRQDRKLPYWFDWNSIDFNKSSYEYNWDLSVLAFGITLSAFESYKGTYSDGSSNAKAFLVDELGFEQFRENEDYKTKPDADSIGVCAANKKIKVNGTEDCTVIVMPIRGAGYEAEWASNATVDNITYHKGFWNSADKALSFLKNYIIDNKITGRIKILVTGYSRAAGVTNLTTYLLDSGGMGEISGVSLKNEDIYGFCFEPPAVTTRKNDTEKYGNIFSFINPRDFVPRVPSTEWGFKHFGKQMYFPDNSDLSIVYEKIRPQFIQKYAELSGCDYNTSEFKPYVGNKNGLHGWITDIVDGLSINMSQKEYANKVQTLLRESLSNGLSDVSGNLKSEMGMKDSDGVVLIILKSIVWIAGKREIGDVLKFLNQLSMDENYEIPAEITRDRFYDPSYVKSWKIWLKGVTVYGYAAKAAKGLYDTITTDNNGELLMQEHYPLVNFSWLLLCKDKQFYSDGSSRYLIINCPVDVYLYDIDTNKLAAKIESDNTTLIDGSPVVPYMDGKGQKVFIVPTDRNYRVEVKATDNGTVDYTILERSEEEGYTKRIDYTDIEIKTGDTLIGEFEKDSYSLSKEGVVQTPDIREVDQIQYHSVSLNTNSDCGIVIGQGTYMNNEHILVQAVADPDTIFEGWYEGDTLVSEDAEYRFRVEKDIELTARFKTIDGIRISSIEPQEYTGYALTPDIMLYDGSQELTQGADYTVSYKNNKNAFTFEDEDKLTDAQKKKAPQATIKMKGSYTGQKTVYFNIEPLKIDDGSLFEASLKPGKALKAVFKYNGKALKENRDYKVDAINSDSVTITGTGNFTGTCTFPLKGGTELTVVPISKAIADPIPVQYYTGVELTGDTFKMGPDGDTKYEFRICYPKGEELKEGSDYEIAKVINGRKPGTGTVVIKGLRADGTGEGSTKYSFTGERYLKFKIAPRSIELAEVTSSGDIFAVPYNKAGAKIPGLTVTVNGTALKEGRDYTVKYSKNTAFVGTSTTSGSDPVAVITGKGNYKDTKKVNFTIVKREFSTVSGITVVAPDRPEGKKAGDYATAVKVFDSEGKLLKAGTDYEKDVKYFTSDGNEASKDTYPKAGDILTVKVTGRGGYLDGTIEASYKILNKGETNDISKASIKIDQLSFGNGPATLDGNNAGKVHAAIGKDKKALTFSTDGTSGDLMVLPGSYVNNDRKGTASVTLIGINGYSGCKTVKFKVGARSLAEWWKGLFK